MSEFRKSRSNLHKYYTNQITQPNFPRISSGCFRPSEASVVLNKSGLRYVEGTCARKVWYRLKGIPPVEGRVLPHAVNRMEIGKDVEKSCIESYKKAGIYVANNIPFETTIMGVNIKGEVDCINRTEPGSYEGNYEKYIVEDKSVYGYGAQKDIFGKALFPRAEYGSPKWSHLLQVGFYLLHYGSFPKDHPAYLDFATLHYTDRGDGHYGTFEVELEKVWRFLPEGGSIPVNQLVYWSEDLNVPVTKTGVAVEDVISRFAMINSYLDKDTPPPRDFQLEFSEEEIEKRYSLSMISKSDYEAYKKSHGPRGKGKETIGDWACSPLYCGWKSLCWCCDGENKEE